MDTETALTVALVLVAITASVLALWVTRLSVAASKPPVLKIGDEFRVEVGGRRYTFVLDTVTADLHSGVSCIGLDHAHYLRRNGVEG